MYGKGWLSPIDEVAEAKRPSIDPARQKVDETPQNDVGTTIVSESSNITSGNTNWFTALARKAAVQFVQEICLTKEQITLRTNEAKEAKKDFIGGATDPKQGKAAAGVGTISLKEITFYPLANPTNDYLDVEAIGRCMIL